jgi:hypothetical protein
VAELVDSDPEVTRSMHVTKALKAEGEEKIDSFTSLKHPDNYQRQLEMPM